MPEHPEIHLHTKAVFAQIGQMAENITQSFAQTVTPAFANLKAALEQATIPEPVQSDYVPQPGVLVDHTGTLTPADIAKAFDVPPEVIGVPTVVDTDEANQFGAQLLSKLSPQTMEIDYGKVAPELIEMLIGGKKVYGVDPVWHHDPTAPVGKVDPGTFPASVMAGDGFPDLPKASIFLHHTASPAKPPMKTKTFQPPYGWYCDACEVHWSRHTGDPVACDSGGYVREATSAEHKLALLSG